MKLWLDAGFQLLLATAFSFGGAIAIVRLGALLLRLPPGRLSLLVLSLPFLKALAEFARGIPSDAFFWLKAQGLAQELGTFRIGLGIERFYLVVEMSLGAIFAGQTYAQSAADLLWTALCRHVGSWAPACVVLALCAGALARLLHALSAQRSLTGRLSDAGQTQVGIRRSACRSVRVVTSRHWSGVPFVHGLLRPCIVFSERVYAQLSPAEREAVIQHELGHVGALHGLLLGSVTVLTALFWFVPGAEQLRRAVQAQCELSADDAALRAGCPSEALAAALVRVGELCIGRAPAPSWAVGLFERTGLLSRRIERLLSERSSPPRRLLYMRAVGVVILGTTVLRATTFGNP